MNTASSLPPLPEDPIVFFAQLYDRVHATDMDEPSAATLATATVEGKPSARVVLVKAFDEHGFVFYTNLRSQKASELRANPQAALCFYWEPIHYQVRVQGQVKPVSDEEADAYFATRPRGSQVGAWISKQSQVLDDPRQLEYKFKQFMREFEGQQISRPDFWSGFRLAPERMEFWKRGTDRLHERVLYLKKEAAWSRAFLYP